MSTPYTYARPARTQARDFVSSCSPYRVSYGLLREVATEDAVTPLWESFDEKEVPRYIACAAASLREQLTAIEDYAKPYTREQEKQLLFTVEALTHSRRLMDACRAEAAA
jgi:hypothetical protein